MNNPGGDMRTMLKWVESIRKIVVKTIDALHLPKVLQGKVQETAPLKIFVDAKLILPDQCLMVPSYLRPMTAYTEENPPVKVNIDNGLHKGDKVILMQIQGGQKYVVLGVMS